MTRLGAVPVLAVLLAMLTAVAWGSGGAPEISTLNVLLPYCDRNTDTEYRLEAYNGCYRWTSTNEQVAQVKPLFENAAQPSCSQSAIIRVTSTQSGRQKTIVFAEHLASGKLLRCEVHVDRIQRIEVTHTTRSIYVDDLEEIGVHAFDADDNLFSTVEGLRVEWSIVPSKNHTKYKNAASILQLVPYKDASIKVSTVRRSMEELGQLSSATLVKGIKTGVATVQAVLQEKAYADVQPARVDLSVFQPLLLMPYSATTIFRGQTFPYALLTKKGNARAEIKLPDAHFRWSTGDAKVAQVNNLAQVQGKQLGATEVTVSDADMPENDARALVRVADTGFLEMTVYAEQAPGSLQSNSSTVDTWHLVHGVTYELDVQCYTFAGDRYNTSSVALDLRFLGAAQTPKLKSNGRYTLQVSKDTKLEVELMGFTNRVGRGRVQLRTQGIKAAQRIVMTSPVRIVRGEAMQDAIRLPTPQKGSQQSLQLAAEGGSREYYWEVADAAVASVDQAALLLAATQGSTVVRVADRRNPSNADSMEVHVAPVKALEFVQALREAEIGSVQRLNMSVVALDGEGNVFSACSNLDLAWVIHDTSVFESAGAAAARDSAQASQAAHLCGRLTLVALRKGHTSVEASHGGVSAEATIGAYEALQARTPSGAPQVLLTPGSSVRVQVQGGPSPWPFDPTAHEETLTPSKAQEVRIERQADGAYVLTCLAYGEQELRVFVGNTPSHTNTVPGNATATLWFACKQPHVLLIVPERTRNVSERCSQSSDRFVYRNSQRIRVDAHVLDDKGNRFDNFSSTPVAWTSSNEEQAKLEGDASSWRTMPVGDWTGKVKIGARISAFSARVLRSVGLRASFTLKAAVEHTVEMELVANVHLSPSRVSIFHHRDNVVRLRATGGSGVFTYAALPGQHVAVRPGDDSRWVELRPLQLGSQVQLQVQDECLQQSDLVSSSLSISRVLRLEVSVQDKLLLGASNELRLRVLDTNGMPFTVEQFELMRIEMHTDTSAVVLTPVERGVEEGGENATEAVYTVFGAHLGTTRISFSARGEEDGVVVSSGKQQVVVYSPLRVEPSRMILIPGAVHQLTYSGGPHNARMTYASDNGDVVAVSADGLVTGLRVGSTTVQVRAQGYDSLTGKLITYGKDTVSVTVKKITGLAIHASSNTLTVGQRMTVRVHGVSGETPFSFGLAQIPFRWQISNGELAELRPVYHRAGMPAEMHSQFSMEVEALQVGTATLSVRVVPGSGLDLRNFTDMPLPQLVDSMSMSVVPPLALEGPSSVLLPPGSEYVVRTNLDTKTKLRYAVFGSEGCSEPLVSVDSKGNVRHTGEQTGTAFVTVSDRSTGQSVVLRVQIKAVHQLSLHAAQPFRVDVPIHSQANFELVLRDELGVAFDSHQGVDFGVQVNRRDVVGDMRLSNENRTASFTALRQGQVVVRVFVMGGDHIADYVRLTVGSAIAPASPRVLVGGVVQLESSIESGAWQSSDSEVVAVDESTGLAHALKAGTAVVSSAHGDSKSSTPVRVVTVSKLSIEMGKLSFATNVPVERPPSYALRVNVFDAAGHELVDSGEEGGARVQHRVQVACSVDQSEWASTAVQLERGTGAVYCMVHPVAASAQNFTQETVEQLDVRATLVGNSAVAAHAVVPFVPAFVLENRGRAIELTQEVRSENVRVFGKPSQLEAVSTDSGRVQVRMVRMESTRGSAVFEVRVVKTRRSFEGVYVLVSNTVTGQKQRVPVVYKTKATQEELWRAEEARRAAEEAEEAGGAEQVQVVYSEGMAGASWSTVVLVSVMGLAGVWLMRWCVGARLAPQNVRARREKLFSPMRRRVNERSSTGGANSSGLNMSGMGGSAGNDSGSVHGDVNGSISFQNDVPAIHFDDDTSMIF